MKFVSKRTKEEDCFQRIVNIIQNRPRVIINDQGSPPTKYLQEIAEVIEKWKEINGIPDSE